MPGDGFLVMIICLLRLRLALMDFPPFVIWIIMLGGFCRHLRKRSTISYADGRRSSCNALIIIHVIISLVIIVSVIITRVYFLNFQRYKFYTPKCIVSKSQKYRFLTAGGTVFILLEAKILRVITRSFYGSYKEILRPPDTDIFRVTMSQPGIFKFGVSVHFWRQIHH